jgi:hypothetical protein
LVDCINGNGVGGRKLFLSDNKYMHTAAGPKQDTKFFRRISYIYPAGGNVKIISQVSWDGTGSGLQNSVNISNCNISNKCVWAEVELTGWGG